MRPGIYAMIFSRRADDCHPAGSWLFWACSRPFTETLMPPMIKAAATRTTQQDLLFNASQTLVYPGKPGTIKRFAAMTSNSSVWSFRRARGPLSQANLLLARPGSGAIGDHFGQPKPAQASCSPAQTAVIGLAAR